jgi:hypothetical protein
MGSFCPRPVMVEIIGTKRERRDGLIVVFM